MVNAINRWDTNETLVSALQSNRRIIQRVMKNNAFLLKRADISLNEQLRQIARSSDGFKLNSTRMSLLKAGRDRKINITILSILADYHNLPLETMITKDLWNEGTDNTIGSDSFPMKE